MRSVVTPRDPGADDDRIGDELIRAASRARAARIQLARKDPAAFNEYVLRDEETGDPILNAPMHEAWHSLISEHRRIVLWAHIEAAKTTSISIGRTLWELGRNPNIRIVILSNTGPQAKKILATIAKYIHESEELHRVFPHLKAGEPWTATNITVQRTSMAKDPSVRAAGVHGNVLGARCDLLILDDILDHENTRTEGQREELRRWYRATLGGRMTRGARIIAVGTAWHPRDLMHEFASSRGWISRRFPVEDPVTGEPTWAERWPKDRIEYARTTDLGPLEAMRQLDCKAIDETSQRFRSEWIKRCQMNGAGFSWLHSLSGVQLPEGAFVVVGLDLAFTKAKAGAKTVFTTVLFYPDGTRQLLWIEAGAFSGPEVVMKAVEHRMRYDAVIIVESNGAQRLILEFATDPAYQEVIKQLLPEFDPGSMLVLPFQTGINKWHPTFGVESIGVEMSTGRWIFPDDSGPDGCAAELSSLTDDMRLWDPTAHSGDHIMSMWFAREGGRTYRGPRGNVSVRIFGPSRAGLGRDGRAAATMN